MAVTLFRDVGPRAGGFTIYPNSAKILYPTSEEAKHWVATADSEAAMEHILRTVRPVEFCGKQGDVIFTHGWTAHSAGLHESDQVRCAIIQVSPAAPVAPCFEASQKMLQDINKVRERGPMRWTVAGKGEGEGAKRRSCNIDGLIVSAAAPFASSFEEAQRKRLHSACRPTTRRTTRRTGSGRRRSSG